MFSAESIVALFQIIDDIANECVPFTCFDVTRLLCHKGFTVNHEGVRTIIHGLNGLGVQPLDEFVRNSMVTLNKYGVKAEVYTPLGVAPSSYDPDFLNPINGYPLGNELDEDEEEDESVGGEYPSWEDDDDWFDEEYPFEYEDELEQEEEELDAPTTWPNVGRPGDRVGSDSVVVQNDRVGLVARKAQWPNTGQGAATVVAQPTNPQVTPIKPAKVDVRRAVVDRDNRGRICVPNELTRHVGFHPGKTVYVYPRNYGQSGFVLLKRAPRVDGQHVTTYSVDVHGNVRLTKGTLNEVGLDAKLDSRSVRLRTTDAQDGIVGVRE